MIKFDQYLQARFNLSSPSRESFLHDLRGQNGVSSQCRRCLKYCGMKTSKRLLNPVLEVTIQTSSTKAVVAKELVQRRLAWRRFQIGLDRFSNRSEIGQHALGSNCLFGVTLIRNFLKNRNCRGTDAGEAINCI